MERCRWNVTGGMSKTEHYFRKVTCALLHKERYIQSIYSELHVHNVIKETLYTKINFSY